MKVNEQKEIGYVSKIRRHKLTVLYRMFLILIVIAAIILLIILQYKRHVYTDYDVLVTADRERISGTTDIRVGNSILTYSKDGAHCTNNEGEIVWNRTFEMQDILLSLSGNTIALADYNGRTIYLQNTEKTLAEIDTPMPIKALAASDGGYVTAILDDTRVSWINTYDLKGEMVYKGQAHMSDAGYPAAIALSPDAELLSISYWYTDAGVMKSNIAIYNLGPVGDNYNDHMVSAYSYTDMLVPYVDFMSNSTLFAVGDSRLMLYSGAHKPTMLGEHILQEEIQAVYHSDKYIGLVFNSDQEEGRYRMDVYDAQANLVGNYYFDMEYTDIFFGQDNFVIYNQRQCEIRTMKNVTKFSGEFRSTVNLMIPVGNAYKYLLVTDREIQTIQMK